MPTFGALFGLVAMVAALALAETGHASIAIAVAVVGVLAAVGATVAGAVRGER